MIKNQLLLPVFITALAGILYSCASNEVGQSKDVNQETIYQDYSVVAGNTEGTVTITAQFRFAGANGTTLVLNPPGKFEVDGKEIAVDSSDFSGAFYSITLPSHQLAQQHSMRFTDTEKRKFDNSFQLDSFHLIAPKSADRNSPLQIAFKAPVLSGDDFIEIESEHTDSSFSYRYHSSDNSGYITIPVAELSRQKKNELVITGTLHRKLPLQNKTREGGEINTIQVTKPVKILFSTPQS